MTTTEGAPPRRGEQIDPGLVDEMEEIIRKIAKDICAEQPEVPEPSSLVDLDSFSMVQVLLEIENSMHIKLLEAMEGFQGQEFRDLADYVVVVLDDQGVGGTEGADSAGAPRV